MAPEIVNEYNYDENIDVYSFCILLFFVLNGGKMPKNEMTTKGIMNQTEIPSTFTSYSTELINSCKSFNPKDRPSFEVICNKLTKDYYKVLEIPKSVKHENKNTFNKHPFRGIIIMFHIYSFYILISLFIK